jgi:hypothetical protein
MVPIVSLFPARLYLNAATSRNKACRPHTEYPEQLSTARRICQRPKIRSLGAAFGLQVLFLAWLRSGPGLNPAMAAGGIRRTASKVLFSVCQNGRCLIVKDDCWISLLTEAGLALMMLEKVGCSDR